MQTKYRATMVRQANGSTGHEAESIMMDYKKRSNTWQNQVAGNVGKAARAQEAFLQDDDETREPYPDFQAMAKSQSEREEYGLETRTGTETYGNAFTNHTPDHFGVSASNELAQKLKHRRDSDTSLNALSTMEDRGESSSAMSKLDSAENMLLALVLAVDSNIPKDVETGNASSSTTNEVTCDQDLQDNIDTTPINVKALISKHDRQVVPVPPKSGSSTNEWSRNTHRITHVSTKSKHGPGRQGETNSTTAPKKSRKIQESQGSDEAMRELSLHDTLDDTSNKLDAALSMMEELRREDADRKILSMMQVQRAEHEDTNDDSLARSKIDWETGEYGHTPWVGQVGINDEIFEDEPLDYDFDESQPNNCSSSKKAWTNKTSRRMLLLAVLVMLVTASTLAGIILYQSHKSNEPCSLCYDGSSPDDMSSSMVGGQTCADFRTSMESYRSSGKMCLQGQSLAWLMCDCPSLPPFPKRPSCTLCGEGVLLDGSACNQINTFMAHISDPNYCEALKSSVSKVGCACPNK